MTAFGRWQHFPVYLGRNDTWHALHESYVENQGTALGRPSVTRDARLYAKSRALYVALNQAARVEHMWNPFRMVPEILERWEALMSLPGSGRPSERRQAVAERFQAFGIEGTHQAMVDLARSIAGDLYAGIVYHDPADMAALGYAATVPGGVTGSGHINYEDGPWRSGVYSVVVQLDHPSSVPLAELQQIGTRVVDALQRRFAAYLHISWSRNTGTGFILGQSLLGIDPLLDE